MSQPIPTPPLPQIFPGLIVTSSIHLHSHHTPQHPMSHPHAFPASAFPSTCHCMHLCTFTPVCVHPTYSLPAPPHIMHPPWPDIMDDGWHSTATSCPPNELSLCFTHQTLISGIKHCCTLQHLLHPQDLFWECIPHGSSPPDSFTHIRTVLKVVSICPQHCAKLPMHFNISICLISLLSQYFTYEITLLLFRCHPTTFLAPFVQCLK